MKARGRRTQRRAAERRAAKPPRPSPEQLAIQRSYRPKKRKPRTDP